MNKLLFLLIPFLWFTDGERNTFTYASRQIDKRTYVKRKKGIAPRYHLIRMKLLEQLPTGFLHHSIDTLFMIEGLSIENGEVDSDIWNQQHQLSYQYLLGDFTFHNEPRFTRYMRLLVQRWDTAAIRNEEAHTQVLDGRSISAYRIIAQGPDKDPLIDKISFTDFFDLKRD